MAKRRRRRARQHGNEGALAAKEDSAFHWRNQRHEKKGIRLISAAAKMCGSAWQKQWYASTIKERAKGSGVAANALNSRISLSKQDGWRVEVWEEVGGGEQPGPAWPAIKRSMKTLGVNMYACARSSINGGAFIWRMQARRGIASVATLIGIKWRKRLLSPTSSAKAASSASSGHQPGVWRGSLARKSGDIASTSAGVISAAELPNDAGGSGSAAQRHLEPSRDAMLPINGGAAKHWRRGEEEAWRGVK